MNRVEVVIIRDIPEAQNMDQGSGQDFKIAIARELEHLFLSLSSSL